jgi:hypothetical protein
MVQDQLVLVLVVVTVALLPTALLWGFLKLIDYGADEEKIEEIRQASREGRQPDLTGISGGSRGIEERDVDDFDSPGPATGPTPSASPAASTAEDTVTCPSCGSENDADFDRCWDCLGDL